VSTEKGCLMNSWISRYHLEILRILRILLKKLARILKKMTRNTISMDYEWALPQDL